MRSRLFFFPVAFVVWLILCWPPDLPQSVVGLVVAGLVTWISGDLFVGRHQLLRHPMRYVLFLFQYLPLLLWEVFKANLDVAVRVIRPSMPIHPGIVSVRTSLISDIGLTCLANSITLTPGTMTVDVDRVKGVLYIHWIDVKARDMEAATRMIVSRFEPLLKRIFEEDLPS
jgi:multicomponent Na+:H+ antiporter subunit E